MHRDNETREQYYRRCAEHEVSLAVASTGSKRVFHEGNARDFYYKAHNEKRAMELLMQWFRTPPGPTTLR
jgi:hypothetical protein